MAETLEYMNVPVDEKLNLEHRLDELGFDDAEVIKTVLNGAVDNFELLVNRYKTKVGWIVAARVRPEDIEEVTHQSFVRAFKFLSSFGGKAPFENWLSRLAVHCCHDYWRMKRRDETNLFHPGETLNYSSWLELIADVVNESELAETAKMAETKMALEQAMGELDGDERWLLESHYYEGMPLKEAAATLGWSLVKTKVKAMRTRMKLKKAINTLISEWSK